jgi:hypothetical protein
MLHYIRVTDGIITCYLDEFGIKGLRTRRNLFTIHHCDFIAQQLTTGTTVYLYIQIPAIIRAIYPLFPMSLVLIQYHYHWSIKAKAVPLHAMKAFGGEELYLLLILDLCTRWPWVVSFTPRPCFNPWERTESWVGPRYGLDTEVRGKILSPLPGIEPPSPGLQPLARHYTDWATLLPYTWPNFNAHCLPQILSWLSRESVVDNRLDIKKILAPVNIKRAIIICKLAFLVLCHFDTFGNSQERSPFYK